jgi:hypothetical protein
VQLSDAAAAHFEGYVVQARLRAKEATGLLAGAWGKVSGYVLRLALVLEYLSWSEAGFRAEPLRIGETAMLWAIGLIDGYFMPMARRVFGEAAIPEEERRAMELARWIVEARPERFNARETRRQIGGSLRDSKPMSQACEVLAQAGWIRPVAARSGTGGGRTPSDYEVNPALLTELKQHEHLACKSPGSALPTRELLLGSVCQLCQMCQNPGRHLAGGRFWHKRHNWHSLRDP